MNHSGEILRTYGAVGAGRLVPVKRLQDFTGQVFHRKRRLERIIYAFCGKGLIVRTACAARENI
jgi:hypothetical protein